MNHDEWLDKVLGEFNAARPASGFEQRMLLGIAERQRVKPPVRRNLFALGLAGTVVCAGLAMIFAVHSRPSATAPKLAKPAALALAGPAQRPARRMPGREARRPASASVPAVTVAATREVAASFPAPPLPLTDQERLLQRIAHTGDPQVFAALNAEARRLAEQARRQDYEAYFASPPPSEDVLQTIKLQKTGESR